MVTWACSVKQEQKSTYHQSELGFYFPDGQFCYPLTYLTANGLKICFRTDTNQLDHLLSDLFPPLLFNTIINILKICALYSIVICHNTDFWIVKYLTKHYNHAINQALQLYLTWHLALWLEMLCHLFVIWCEYDVYWKSSAHTKKNKKNPIQTYFVKVREFIRLIMSIVRKLIYHSSYAVN